MVRRLRDLDGRDGPVGHIGQLVGGLAGHRPDSPDIRIAGQSTGSTGSNTAGSWSKTRGSNF
jgi:hypothetical protein